MLCRALTPGAGPVGESRSWRASRFRIHDRRVSLPIGHLLLVHAWSSSPASNGGVTAPSRMEQSVEAARGRSQLVRSGKPISAGIRARSLSNAQVSRAHG